MKRFLAIAVLLIAARAWSQTLTVGSRTTQLNPSQRGSVEPFWPDGTMDALAHGGTNWIFAPSLAPSAGTVQITLPNLNTWTSGLSIVNPTTNISFGGSGSFDQNYAGGGGYYNDPSTGILMQVYHGEQWFGGSGAPFYAALGLAYSNDFGVTWHKLGEIISPQSARVNGGINCQAETGVGPMVVVGTFLYVYYTDTQTGCTGGVKMAVARASIASVIAAAQAGTPFTSGAGTLFKKYTGSGTWNGNGVTDLANPAAGGGAFTQIGPTPTTGANTLYVPAVRFDSFNSEYLVCYSGSFQTIECSWSADGLTAWSTPQVIASGGSAPPNANYYPALFNTGGGDPQTLGQNFTLFYVAPFGTWTSTNLYSVPLSLPGGTSFTLSTTTTGTGSGTITGCGGSHLAGTGYSCAVTPAAGSTLISVSGCSGSGTTTFAGTMPSSNCTVTANFTSGTTINAASCSQVDFLAALNAVTATTTVVNVPAGVCNYTTQLIWTRPSSNTNLTIKGQTVVTCTGTPSTSSYACTSTDNTVIKDSIASNVNPIQITMSGNNPFLFTGFTIEGGTGVVKNNGLIIFNGPNHKFRVGYNHFDVDTYTTSFSTFTGRLFGDIAGVLDHNIYDNGHASTLSQGFALSNPYNDTIGNGDGPWTQPENFGSQEFIYIEDSIMNWGELQDCDTGAKFVARYNTINFGSAGSAPIHAHGTKSQAGPGRGCRAYEAYMNYITGPPGSSFDAVFGSAGGPSLVWGNTIARGFNWGGAISNTRSDCSENETNTPNGWGYCGTAAKIPSACTTTNGTGSNWDGNSGANGYPCMDGIGRGKGQALNGAGFPGRLNAITNSIAYPQQLLVPTYYFMNSYGVAAALRVNGNDAATAIGRDVYFEAGSSVNPGCTSAFNGSCGTGFGTHSARPTSCTPGPGGTFGTSPVGSYGVAWFSTDLNQLSVCTGPSAWTENVYTPLVHPHPLVSGTTSVADPVLSPTPGTFTGSQTVSITDATSGVTIRYTIDGSVPTSSSPVYSGPLTVGTTTTVNTFASLTGMANSNVVTGTYTINLATCPDPHQKGPWFSATYHVPNITLPVVVDWTEADATCTMRYTSDGSAPTSSSPVWPSGGINLFSTPLPNGITYRVVGFSTTGGSDSNPPQGGQWIIIFDLPGTFPSLMQGLPQY